jgi:hypothetical protein
MDQFADVAAEHMATPPLTDEQIASIADGITEADTYTIYSSPDGRTEWRSIDVPSGRLAANYVRIFAKAHTLTGSADGITVAPDGRGGDLAWYRMERQEQP